MTHPVVPVPLSVSHIPPPSLLLCGDSLCFGSCERELIVPGTAPDRPDPSIVCDGPRKFGDGRDELAVAPTGVSIKIAPGAIDAKHKAASAAKMRLPFIPSLSFQALKPVG